MRLVSWNMKRRKTNWDYLLSALQPDIALLQESGRIENGEIAKCAIEAEVKPHFRNTVYSPLNTEKIKMPRRGNPEFNVVSVDAGNSGTVYCIGIYIRSKPSHERDMRILGSLGRITWILREQHKAEHIIIGGDFNIDPKKMDDPARHTGRGGYNKFHGLFHNIGNLGFTDCLKAAYPDGVQTHRHNRSDYPWQIDHIFATNALYERIRRVEVLENDEIRKRSDHNPIVIDFDAPAGNA